jgi:hypothetical protein
MVVQAFQNALLQARRFQLGERVSTTEISADKVVGENGDIRTVLFFKSFFSSGIFLPGAHPQPANLPPGV